MSCKRETLTERMDRIKRNLQIGVNIWELRKGLKIDQETLAERLGYYSQSAISRFENGLVASFTVEQLVALAGALETNLSALLKGIE